MGRKTMNYFKFTENASEEKIRKDIIKAPAKFLATKLATRYSFGNSELINNGAYKEMGWYYCFRPYLKHYIYQQFGSWHDVYALNKTNLRKLIGGRIERIIELK